MTVEHIRIDVLPAYIHFHPQKCWGRGHGGEVFYIKGGCGEEVITVHNLKI